MANNLSGFYLTQPGLWTDSVAPSSGTRAAPTAATEGMDLGGVLGFRVIVSADSTKVLTGTGNMLAWLYDPDLARWSRNPDLDFPITASGVTWTNVRDRVSPDYQVSAPYGRVVFAASGVTVDAGGVTVQIAAQKAGR